MTHPSDPGHPPRSQGPGQPGGPYDPPPRPQGPGVPGPRPPGPGPQEGPLGWAPPQHSDKGLLGSLLDADFDSLVTPKLIRTFYILSLLVVSLECLGVAVVGLWFVTSTEYWVTGAVLVLATPLIWLFQMLLVRFFMEAVVVRFKQAEYLRIIKDRL